MKKKLIFLGALALVILTNCENCKKGKIDESEKTVVIEANGVDGEPLTGSIIIFKSDGKGYTIQVEDIACHPEPEDFEEESPQEECYTINLYPGKYKLVFYDAINDQTYTKMLNVT